MIYQKSKKGERSKKCFLTPLAIIFAFIFKKTVDHSCQRIEQTFRHQVSKSDHFPMSPPGPNQATNSSYPSCSISAILRPCRAWTSTDYKYAHFRERICARQGSKFNGKYALFYLLSK
jgi:hypothetical protein